MGLGVGVGVGVRGESLLGDKHIGLGIEELRDLSLAGHKDSPVWTTSRVVLSTSCRGPQSCRVGGWGGEGGGEGYFSLCCSGSNPVTAVQ